MDSPYRCFVEVGMRACCLKQQLTPFFAKQLLSLQSIIKCSFFRIFIYTVCHHAYRFIFNDFSKNLLCFPSYIFHLPLLHSSFEFNSPWRNKYSPCFSIAKITISYFLRSRIVTQSKSNNALIDLIYSVHSNNMTYISLLAKSWQRSVFNGSRFIYVRFSLLNVSYGMAFTLLPLNGTNTIGSWIMNENDTFILQ